MSLSPPLEGLKGQRVGVQKATTHELYLTRKLGGDVELVRFDTLPKAEADMLARKVDFVFGDAMALSQGFLKTDKGKAFAFVGPDIRIGSGIGIGVRKGQPDLVANLNRALGSIQADGTYDKIAAKYFDFLPRRVAGGRIPINLGPPPRPAGRGVAYSAASACWTRRARQTASAPRGSA